MGVRVAPLATAHPNVAPADASPGVLRRHQRRSVSPHIDEHPVEIGDAAFGERLGQCRIVTDKLIDLMPIVGCHVGVMAREVLTACDLVLDVLYERDGGSVVVAVGGVEA